MFKHIKIIPISALVLATFMSVPAFAKVPFHAGQANRENVTAVATHPYMHQGYMHQGYMHRGYMHRSSMHRGYMQHGRYNTGYHAAHWQGCGQHWR